MSKLMIPLVLACSLFVSGNAFPADTQYDPISMDPRSPDATYPPDFHELLMPSHGVMLTGFMLGANGAGPHPTVLLVHGFPGNEKNLDLAQSLRRGGYNVLFFHYRGAWGSQGDYTIAGQVDDVAAVVDYVRKNADTLRADTNRLSIIGHSLGGFTALQSAARVEALRCVVGVSAHNFEPETIRSEQQLQGLQTYVDQLFMLNNFSGAQFLAEVEANTEAFDNRNLAAKLSGKSVLLIAGSEDTAVSPAIQTRLVEVYEKNPEINLTAKVIPGDHAFSVSRILLQRTVIDWMNSNCR